MLALQNFKDILEDIKDNTCEIGFRLKETALMQNYLFVYEAIFTFFPKVSDIKAFDTYLPSWFKYITV